MSKAIKSYRNDPKKESQEQILEEVLRFYKDYSEYVDILNDSISMLITDLEAVEKGGYTLHFAIDFAELYALAFPVGNRHMYRFPGETDAQTYSRELTTLTFLKAKVEESVLTKTKSFVMLPPYIQEMRSTLSLIRDRLIQIYVLLNILNDVQAAAFSKVTFSDSGVNDIVSRVRKGREVTDQERRTIIKYLQTHYRQVVASLILASCPGANLIQEMSTNGVILDLESHIKKYCEGAFRNMNLTRILNHDLVKRDSQRYLNEILKKSWRKSKIWPNRNDAEACAILELINDEFQKMNSKDLMLLISHSKAVADAMKTRISIEVGERTRKVKRFRDLNYFWLYYAHQKPNRRDMLVELGEWRSDIRKFRNTYKRLQKNTKDISPTDKRIKHARNQLQRIRELFSYYENLAMAARTNERVYTYLREVSTTFLYLKYTQNVRWGLDVVHMIDTNYFAEDFIEELRKIKHKTIDKIQSLKEIPATNPPRSPSINLPRSVD